MSLQVAARPTQRHIPLRDSVLGLGSLILPGAGFAAVMVLAAGKFSGIDLKAPLDAPWQLWVIGVAGLAATVCGFLDWHYHATGRRLVSAKERKGELIALLFGGLPLFALMTAATVAASPLPWLVPIIVVALFTTVMISYDEFVFHRRGCTRYETALHRVLVIGNATAWLAWMHWVFSP